MTDVKRIAAVKAARPIRPLDAVILSLVLILALVLTLTGFSKKGGATLDITVNGQSTQYALNRNRVIEVSGLTVTVEAGVVRVTEATCPDKQCLRRAIRYKGERIVCLPNNVVLTILGEAEIQIPTG